MSDYILEMKGITKEFPGVRALDHVNFKVKDGEIHGLVGENGAGKSTLMKVLSGVYPYGSYKGEILFKGEVCKFKDIKQSESLGIVIIHQEFALIPQLSIAENIFLGNEKTKRHIIDWNETILKTKDLLEIVGLDEDPQTIVGTLGVGKQQLVEIAKALSKEVKLLILDEPTAALNEEDSKNLLELIKNLKKQGITSIIITHKLKEILAVADSITILRDGKTIETLDLKKDKVTEERIIRGMVGRDISQLYPSRNVKIGDTIFEVKNWNVYHPTISDKKIVNQVNLHIKKGEVVGIAGLIGAGRTEFAMSIFGKSYGKNISGEIFINGKKVELHNVQKAINSGLAYLTEDRKTYGLNLIENIKNNITSANLNKVAINGVINNNKEIVYVNDYIEKFNIKASSLLQKIENLSGGNQQKVLLSKWIFTDPVILILDEPTRGIDVGAKYEIYSIINQLAAQGKGILLISSELPELIGMCDRIYVMSKGKITGEVPAAEATQESIMKLMTKGEE
ncbi:multiple monosaccharide ABC transporter ATP-binding protein [Caldibacillus debilis]|uniref:multiple monosaccharide ABC transporter ATP-binding protein n=1 Tax=Caldibacillus debilis TaxID=301148 RepID=UPI000E37896F|nr:multiple monosaccharide ABC transporter ATP-binding protein [Caldibacillus debilis]REJ28749.1 MAG: ABC transporter ATP-binding protein [Caldibacillus debilis]